MPHDPTELVLGRGEVFFDPFAPGTMIGSGERYLGNTPSFQIGRSLDRLARYRSYSGRKHEVRGKVIAEAHSLTFITDHISMENVASWYGGTSETVAQASAGAITEPFTTEPGRFIQLGRSVRPMGLRNVTSVVVRIGTTIVPAANNYLVDPALGRIEILKGAPAFTGPTNITVQFARGTAVTRNTRSQAVELHGAMTFISRNVEGPRKNIFIPYLRLSSRGMVDLKGDEWQQMPFEATILKLNPRTEQVYLDEMVT